MMKLNKTRPSRRHPALVAIVVWTMTWVAFALCLGLGLPANSWGGTTSIELALNAQLSRKITQDQLARQAAYMLAVAATTDSDGYPLPAAPQAGSGPAGGGLIPATSVAPKTDGYGVALGYCAWDNGSVTSHAGYIAGSLNLAAVTLAVVSPGADNLFETTCAQIAAGQAAGGDDYVVSYTAGQVMGGVQSATYFASPVANYAALQAIDHSTLTDGQARLTLDSNTLYVYHAAAGTWSVVSGSYFAPTGHAGDIFYKGGSVAIGQSTASNALSVTGADVPLSLNSTGQRNGMVLLDSVTGPTTNAFIGFDKMPNAVRLEAQAAGSSIQFSTGGGIVTVTSTGVLQAPQGLVAPSITSASTLTLNATGVTINAPVTVAAGLQATALSVGTNAVWHAGNFNPSTKADSNIKIIAGSGLLGGGSLGSDVTLALAYAPADSARKFTVANGLALNGTVNGSSTFASDLTVSLPNSGVTAGTYSNFTVDVTGRVTAAHSLAALEVTTALGYTPVNPTRKIIAGTGLLVNGTTSGTLASDVTVALGNSGVAAGTYSNLQVDATGRVTAAHSLAASEVTAALTYRPVSEAGDTMSGPLTLSRLEFNNTLNSTSQSATNGKNGIGWWSATTDTWSEYMAPGGRLNTGPTGTLTTPAGYLVTSWALRSYVDSAAGAGWTFEKGAPGSSAPSIVGEIRSSDGSSAWAGSIETNGSIRATGLGLGTSLPGTFGRFGVEIGAADNGKGGTGLEFSYSRTTNKYLPLLIGASSTLIYGPPLNTTDFNNGAGVILASFDATGYGAPAPILPVMTVNGSIFVTGNGTVTAKSFVPSSDGRLKHNIVSLDADRLLKSFMAVRPVEFDFNGSNDHNYGYIAQELQTLFPAMVVQRPDGYFGVNYSEMISVIHSVVQRHETLIEDLRQNKLDGVAGQWTKSSDSRPRFYFEPNGKTVIRGHGDVALEVHNAADQSVASFASNGDLTLGGQLGLGAQGAVSFAATGARIRSNAPGQIAVEATSAARAALLLQYSPQAQAQAAGARIFGMLVGDDSGLALADAAGKPLLTARRQDGAGHVAVDGDLTVVGDVHLPGNSTLRGLADGTLQVETSQGLRVYNPQTKQAAVTLGADGSVVASRFVPTQVVVPYTSCAGFTGSVARDESGQPVVCTQ